MPIVVEALSYNYMSGSTLSNSALSDVSLTVNEGEFLGIIGHTGSGKSTLVQHLNGLLQPTSGSVTVDGYSMQDKKSRIEGRKRVGIVFQYPEYQLFEETVAQDIAYGPHNMGLDKEETDKRVREAMALVGLDYERFAGKSPFELSGGEKRRAAIAGTIAMRPRYLVLDEPMAGLDPLGRHNILEMINSLRRTTGCTVLMVSHSMDDMARCAERIIVLSEGRLVKTGTPREIFGQPELLLSINLDIPQICLLAQRLRARGIDVPEGIYEAEELEAFILGRMRNV